MPNYVDADLFGVSPPTASRVFITWVNLVFHVLSPLLHWSSREVIADTMPQKFRDFNPDTHVIIDCTEIYLERPSGHGNQAATYNSYTSSNTAKVLVSIGPYGVFTYLAAPFGGSVSDRYIVCESGFLDDIEAGDDVMADRGFTIRDLLLDKGATLTIPAFTRKCKYGKARRLNVSEVTRTNQIAKLQIHVERAIRYMKGFRILAGIVLLSLPTQ